MHTHTHTRTHTHRIVTTAATPPDTSTTSSAGSCCSRFHFRSLSPGATHADDQRLVTETAYAARSLLVCTATTAAVSYTVAGGHWWWGGGVGGSETAKFSRFPDPPFAQQQPRLPPVAKQPVSPPADPLSAARRQRYEWTCSSSHFPDPFGDSPSRGPPSQRPDARRFSSPPAISVWCANFPACQAAVSQSDHSHSPSIPKSYMIHT